MSPSPSRTSASRPPASTEMLHSGGMGQGGHELCRREHEGAFAASAVRHRSGGYKSEEQAGAYSWVPPSSGCNKGSLAPPRSLNFVPAVPTLLLRQARFWAELLGQ